MKNSKPPKGVKPATKSQIVKELKQSNEIVQYLSKIRDDLNQELKELRSATNCDPYRIKVVLGQFRHDVAKAQKFKDTDPARSKEYERDALGTIGVLFTLNILKYGEYCRLDDLARHILYGKVMEDENYYEEQNKWNC